MAEHISFFYDAYDHPEDKTKTIRWMKIATVINLLLALFTLYCYFQGQQTARLIIFMVFLLSTVIFGLIGLGLIPLVQSYPRGQHYARIADNQLSYRFMAFAKIKTIPLAGVEAVGISRDAIVFFYPDNVKRSFPSHYIYHDDKRLELERLLQQHFPAPSKTAASTPL